ncbi:MAG: hypothetical protein KAS12_07375, partial [Candidatus Aenigmarchaeota archaeon]|nr:hypothetical protein [Candidatus Aenigmarchaeota archaeon]
PSVGFLDLVNYTIHKIDSFNFALGGVDLSSAVHGKEALRLLKEVKHKYEQDILDLPVSICLKEFAKTEGLSVSLKEIMAGKTANSGKDINYDFCSKEQIGETEDDITLCISKKRYAWVNELKKEYRKYLKQGIPEPISEKMIAALFS